MRDVSPCSVPSNHSAGGRFAPLKILKSHPLTPCHQIIPSQICPFFPVCPEEQPNPFLNGFGTSRSLLAGPTCRSRSAASGGICFAYFPLLPAKPLRSRSGYRQKSCLSEGRDGIPNALSLSGNEVYRCESLEPTINPVTSRCMVPLKDPPFAGAVDTGETCLAWATDTGKMPWPYRPLYR
jgi:hypothetical protein